MTKTKIIVIAAILTLAFPVFAAREQKSAYDNTRQVKAVLNSKKKKYKVPLESSVYQTIFTLSDSYCQDCTLSERDSVLITREDQRTSLQPLVNWIKKQNRKPDSQARIAASLVQKIPYDYDKYNSGGESNGRGHGVRYPYEVLYDNLGICGEKSFLIAFLLKELEFGTAIFYLNENGVNHQVAGVKCSAQYDFKDSGYCFIESVSRRMITYTGSYDDQNNPTVVPLSDGRTFNAKNDRKDAQTWRRLIEQGVSSSKNYKAYKKLVKKYGM
jgi:hypothetical protein